MNELRICNRKDRMKHVTARTKFVEIFVVEVTVTHGIQILVKISVMVSKTRSLYGLIVLIIDTDKLVKDHRSESVKNMGNFQVYLFKTLVRFIGDYRQIYFQFF